MGAGRNFLAAMSGLLASVALPGMLAAQSMDQLQDRFDRETNAVQKAKQMGRLGDAQFAEARRAGKAGDFNTVGLTLEKYRDNVRASVDALKKQHPDAEKQSNGYRQLEMQVQKGLREVEESIIVSPEDYRPPLQLVRQDLIGMDEELLKALFPRRPLEQHKEKPGSKPTEKPGDKPADKLPENGRWS